MADQAEIYQVGIEVAHTENDRVEVYQVGIEVAYAAVEADVQPQIWIIM